jgi:hypothetical protein
MLPSGNSSHADVPCAPPIPTFTEGACIVAKGNNSQKNDKKDKKAKKGSKKAEIKASEKK